MAGEHVLLVEGPEDAHVVKHLCTAHNIAAEVLRPVGSIFADGINIKNEEGAPNLLKNLSRWTRSSEIRRLGVILDADNNAATRWQSVRDALIRAGYSASNIPLIPDPAGLVINQPDQSVGIVGIWLMPGGAGPGMLEDFIQSLLFDNDLLWPRAVDCVDQIPPEQRLFSHPIKAQIHTWLAWQRDPGQQMGAAIRNQWLNANATSAQQFIAWVRRLFTVS